MWAKNNGYFSWFSQVRVLESDRGQCPLCHRALMLDAGLQPGCQTCQGRAHINFHERDRGMYYS